MDANVVPVLGKPKADEVSVELASRRTGMSVLRTRMSADRTLMSVIRTALALIGFGFAIFQFFHKLRESGALVHAGAPRNFGLALVMLGIVTLVAGIVYHLQFTRGLRVARDEPRGSGLARSDSRYPRSFTLLAAVALLVIGLMAISSMVFNVGPFIDLPG
jgi:putative membrane protein